MGGGEEDPQKLKRIAAAAYDYDNDSRWADYWSNVLIPPHMASRNDVVNHFKQKFYQRYIDPELIVEPIGTTSTPQPARTSTPPPQSSSSTSNTNTRQQGSGSSSRTTGSSTAPPSGSTPLRWDQQTIQFSVNAWVFIVAVLAIFPLVPQNLSNRAYRLSFLGTACSSLYSLYSDFATAVRFCHRRHRRHSHGKDQPPTHLIVTVNGIIGSAQNWRYAAKQFVKAYPSEVVVNCSESNSSMLTLDGVDVMGKRLADEVISVVGRHSSLEKISFVGHSLGGVVARYAIAVLYQQDLTRKTGDGNGQCGGEELTKSSVEEKSRGKIAGLEPMNFITVATPHLGARGHKQIPVLCGFHALEKAAVRASGILRRTGKHLFLRDNDNGKPPLLLQMADDSDDLKFVSALQSFRRRVAYGNTNFEHVVGWSSSSLRRLNELPKRQNLVKIAQYSYLFGEDASKSARLHDVPTETKVWRGRICTFS